MPSAGEEEQRLTLEKELLAAELRQAESGPSPEWRLSIHAASLSLSEKSKHLGIHLNKDNVVLRIEPEGLVASDGTLRVGDRIIAINASTTEGTTVQQLLQEYCVISKHSSTPVTLVAARRAARAVAAEYDSPMS